MAKRGRKPKTTNTNTNTSSNTNQQSNVEKMKYEIANEFGVNLGAQATSAENGRVGGEMTKRLVEMAKSSKSRKRSK